MFNGPGQGLGLQAPLQMVSTCSARCCSSRDLEIAEAGHHNRQQSSSASTALSLRSDGDAQRKTRKRKRRMGPIRDEARNRAHCRMLLYGRMTFARQTSDPRRFAIPNACSGRFRSHW